MKPLGRILRTLLLPALAASLLVHALAADAARVAALTAAAEKGDADAANRLGNLYDSGEGVARDEVAARTWFEKAAASGFPKAQFNLGRSLLLGIGGETDIPRALELFAKAADQQLTPAQTFLGQVYYFGEHGQKKDLERAFKLFQPAAEAGDAEAQNFLGVMYRYGMGITLSREQAVHWWDKAAKQNHGKAQASLGDAYLTGTGVANDKLTAIMYFLLAADQNEVTGSQQLEQLTPTLDQETLLEARRRADEFRKQFQNLVDSDHSTGGNPSAPQTHGPQNGPAATATD